ncbi:MAG: type II toxin-antitoxin system VapC family toxin [Desulfurococcales archaeon]|nr:type II toxin-antitoxin system VapC family toxin [Desulfurococcales archaeon]
MTRPTYLFDASSIVKAIKKAKIIPLGGQALQWLTIYEVLNAFWKEANLLHKLDQEEASLIISDFTELLRDVVIIEPYGLEKDILETSISKNITVYDASYIAIALKHNLILVTEDQKLSSKANSMVDVVCLEDL